MRSSKFTLTNNQNILSEKGFHHERAFIVTFDQFATRHSEINSILTLSPKHCLSREHMRPNGLCGWQVSTVERFGKAYLHSSPRRAGTSIVAHVKISWFLKRPTAGCQESFRFCDVNLSLDMRISEQQKLRSCADGSQVSTSITSVSAYSKLIR